MIYSSLTVTVSGGQSKINERILLYRGDREIQVSFEIIQSAFKFAKGENLIDTREASTAQLIIDKPDGTHVFSEVTQCEEGKVVFTITAEMIDELKETGLYTLQIRLFDETSKSRITLPPIEDAIEVREPIAAEDETNIIDIALVDYSVVKDDPFEDLITILPNGDYNKTDWKTGDIISKPKLNKIEDALYTINNTVYDINDASNAIKEDMQTQFDNVDNELNEINYELTQVDANIKDNKNLLNEYLISAPEQQSIADKFLGYKIDADDRILTYNQLINNYYDKLIDGSGYITKTTIGKSTGDGYDIYKYTIKPRAPRMKVLLVGGTHGSECVYPFTLFNMLETFCKDDLYKYGPIQEIRENIEFVVVPILNPHGWDHNTRVNINEVDINRNYDFNWEADTNEYKGPYPFSENESHYVRNLLEEEKPDLFLDLHNTHELDTDFYSTYSSSKNNTFVIRQVIDMMARKKIDETGGCKGVTLDGTSEHPTAQAYSNNILYIPAYTLEWVNSSYSSDNTTWYNATHMTKSLELLINVLYKNLQFFNENQELKTTQVIQINMVSEGSVEVSNSAAYVKIEEFSYETVAPYDCVAKFAGSVTLGNNAQEIINSFSLLNNTGTVDNNEAYANEVYTDYSGRSTLPIFSSFTFKEGQTIKLNLFIKASESTAKIYRYRGLLEIIPYCNKTMKTVIVDEYYE